jgi:hypothetical protein
VTFQFRSRHVPTVADVADELHVLLRGVLGQFVFSQVVRGLEGKLAEIAGEWSIVDFILVTVFHVIVKLLQVPEPEAA